MWIARDKDGSLWLFEDKPKREEDKGIWTNDSNNGLAEICTFLYGISLLSEVTWENSPLELIIKTEEK